MMINFQNNHLSNATNIFCVCIKALKVKFKGQNVMKVPKSKVCAQFGKKTPPDAIHIFYITIKGKRRDSTSFRRSTFLMQCNCNAIF